MSIIHLLLQWMTDVGGGAEKEEEGLDRTGPGGHHHLCMTFSLAAARRHKRTENRNVNIHG